jgi:hypothetical protein
MEDVSIVTQYIRPELLVVVVILYCIALAIKKSTYIKDCFIPFIIGFISLALCAVYVLSVSAKPSGYQEVLSLILDIIIQGVCCAAAAVYFNQLYKQSQKMKDGE